MAYNRHFWNEAEGAYNAAFLGEKPWGRPRMRNCWRWTAGLVPENRMAAVRKWFLANYKNPGGFHCCQQSGLSSR